MRPRPERKGTGLANPAARLYTAITTLPPHEPIPDTTPPIMKSHATIGWFTAACVLVSNIIGGGIFTTTGLLARDLGDPLTILMLWCIGGLFALGGAMIYGELGSILPHAGGDYVYLREAYGPLISFLSGWTSFTIGFGAAVAASAITFSSYALRVIPLDALGGWTAKGLSLTLLWTVTLLHSRGLATGGRLQRLLTTTKVIAVAGFIVAGLFASGSHFPTLRPSGTGPPALGATAIGLIIVIYCYLGWNVASYIAAEIQDPRHTLHRVMIGGTAFVSGLYLLLNVVYLSALSIAELAQEPIVPVAEKAAAALWGPASGRMVAALLSLSIAGAVSAMVWAGPRVYWAMARDGAISPWLAHLHPRTGVPVRAILFQSTWASVLILTGTFEQLLVYSGLVLALFTALSLSTIFCLRGSTAAAGDIYRSPCYPWLPAVLVIGTFSLVCYSLIERPTESLNGMATVLLGIPLYYYWRRTVTGTRS